MKIIFMDVIGIGKSIKAMASGYKCDPVEVIGIEKRLLR
jgi:hypothetical protein